MVDPYDLLNDPYELKPPALPVIEEPVEPLFFETPEQDVPPIPFDEEEPDLLTFAEFGGSAEQYVNEYLPKIFLGYGMPEADLARGREVIEKVRKNLEDQGELKTFGSSVKDLGVSFARGGADIGKGIVGISAAIDSVNPLRPLFKPILKSIASSQEEGIIRGAARQLLEGDSPLRDASRIIDEQDKRLKDVLSPNQQRAQQRLADLSNKDGFIDSAKGAWEAIKENPSVIGTAIARATPQLALSIATGGGGRVAIGASEGSLAFGNLMSDIVNKLESKSPQEINRAYSLTIPDGKATSLEEKKIALAAEARLIALGSGAITGLSSGLLGKTESALARGAGGNSIMQRLGFVVKGFGEEAFEEGIVQGPSETIASNIVDSTLDGEIQNPLKGVGGAVVQGLVTGGAMGGGMGGARALFRNREQPATQVPPVTPVSPDTPVPDVPVLPPPSQEEILTRSAEDIQNEIDGQGLQNENENDSQRLQNDANAEVGAPVASSQESGQESGQENAQQDVLNETGEATTPITEPGENTSLDGDTSGSLPRSEISGESGLGIGQGENTPGNTGNIAQRSDSDASITNTGSGVGVDATTDNTGTSREIELGQPNVLRNIPRETPYSGWEEAPRNRLEPETLNTKRKIIKALDKEARGGDRLEVLNELDTILEKQLARDEEKKRLLNDARRGIDWVKAKLYEARANGALKKEAVDFAIWALSKNPNLANDLGISLRENYNFDGTYNPIRRIITLKKGGSPETVVHEILHHAERMMPKELRDKVVKEWRTRFADAVMNAKGEELSALADVSEAIRRPTPENQEKVITHFSNGTLDYKRHYQLINPSEFWAVNATRLMERYRASGDGVGVRIITWMREFIEKVKSFFNIKSDAAIIRALENIMKSGGGFQGGAILADRVSQEMKDYYGGRVRELYNIAPPAPPDSESKVKPTPKSKRQVKIRTKLGGATLWFDDKYTGTALEADLNKAGLTTIAEKIGLKVVLARAQVMGDWLEYKETQIEPIVDKYKELQKTYNTSKTELDKLLNEMAAYTRGREHLGIPITVNPNTITTAPQMEQAMLNVQIPQGLPLSRYEHAGLETNAKAQLLQFEQNLLNTLRTKPDLFMAVVKDLNPLVKQATDVNKDTLTDAGFPADRFTNYDKHDLFGIGYLPAQLGDMVTVFKKDTGIRLEGDQPIERITSQAGKIIAWASDNEYKGMLYKTAASIDLIGNDGKKVIEFLPRPQAKQRSDGTFDFVLSNDPNALTYWENGKPYEMLITDKSLRDASEFLSRKGLPEEIAKTVTVGVWASLVNAGKALQQGNPGEAATEFVQAGKEATYNVLSGAQQLTGRALVQGLSFPPIAMLRNMTALASNLPTKYSLPSVAWNYGPALATSIANNTRMLFSQEPTGNFAKAKREGAFIDARAVYNLSQVKDNLSGRLANKSPWSSPREYVKKADDTLSFLSNVFDNAARLAIYNAVYEQEIADPNSSAKQAEQRAARVAKETLVDFERSSKASRGLGLFYIFANPSIQGSRTLLRNLRSNKRAQAVAAGLAFLGLLKAALCAQQRDEAGRNQCADQSDMSKNMTLSFPGMNYGMPLEYGINLPWVMGNAIGTVAIEGTFANRTMATEAAEQTKRVASAVMEVFSPIGAPRVDPTAPATQATEWFARLLPTQLQPAVSIGFGKDPFGKQVYPKERGREKENAADFTKSFRTTPQIYKDMTESLYPFIDVSPNTVDLLVKTYGGNVLKDAQFIAGLITGNEKKPSFEGQETRPVLRSMFTGNVPFEFNAEKDKLVAEADEFESVTKNAPAKAKGSQAFKNLMFEVNATANNISRQYTSASGIKDKAQYEQRVKEIRENERKQYLSLLRRRRELEKVE